MKLISIFEFHTVVPMFMGLCLQKVLKCLNEKYEQPTILDSNVSFLYFLCQNKMSFGRLGSLKWFDREIELLRCSEIHIAMFRAVVPEETRDSDKSITFLDAQYFGTD